MTKHEKKVGSHGTADKKHEKKHNEHHHHHQEQQPVPEQPHGAKHGGKGSAGGGGVTAEKDPSLTKRDIKQIEKLEAKIEFHEARDEYDQADELREKILKVKDDAKDKALKKAEKLATGNA